MTPQEAAEKVKKGHEYLDAHPERYANWRWHLRSAIAAGTFKMKSASRCVMAHCSPKEEYWGEMRLIGMEEEIASEFGFNVPEDSWSDRAEQEYETLQNAWIESVKEPEGEFVVQTTRGEMRIAAKSQEQAEAIAVSDGHVISQPQPTQEEEDHDTPRAEIEGA